jgi:hypothetical protein
MKEKAYTEVTESAEDAEKRSPRREIEVLERRSPPFAKSAKDGAPSSTKKGGVTHEKPKKGEERFFASRTPL